MIYQRGFTLIEIIVVIAILTVIFGFGMSVDLNVFKNNTFEGEESKIISLLQKARSRSMSNMFNEAHGLCLDSSDSANPNYIIFRGRTTCLPAMETDDIIPANANMAITFPTIVFNRLTGDTIDVAIHMTDGIKEANIIINNEGAINW